MRLKLCAPKEWTADCRSQGATAVDQRRLAECRVVSAAAWFVSLNAGVMNSRLPSICAEPGVVRGPWFNRTHV